MFKTAGITFGNRLLGAVVNFLLIVFISRNLGVEPRGVCGLYLVIISLITTLADIAGGSAVTFLMVKYHPATLYRTQLWWAICPSILVPIVFRLFSEVSGIETFLLITGGWLNTAWNLQQHFFLGYKRFKVFNIFLSAVPIAVVIVFTLFWSFSLKGSIYYLVSLNAVWLCGFLIGFLVLNILMKNSLHAKAKFSGWEVFKTGLLNQLAHVAGLLNSRMLYFFFPAAGLGLWANALSVSEAIFLVPGSLGQIYYGLAAGNEKSIGNLSIFKRLFLLNLISLSTGVLLLLLLPNTFWTGVFGEGFKGLKYLLMILAPGIFFNGIYLMFSYRFSAMGNFKANFYGISFGLFANVFTMALFWFSEYRTLYAGIIALNAGWFVCFLIAFFLNFKNRKHPL